MLLSRLKVYRRYKRKETAMKKLLFVLVIAMLLCLTALADEAAP